MARKWRAPAPFFLSGDKTPGPVRRKEQAGSGRGGHHVADLVGRRRVCPYGAAGGGGFLSGRKPLSFAFRRALPFFVAAAGGRPDTRLAEAFACREKPRCRRLAVSAGNALQGAWPLSFFPVRSLTGAEKHAPTPVPGKGRPFWPVASANAGNRSDPGGRRRFACGVRQAGGMMRDFHHDGMMADAVWHGTGLLHEHDHGKQAGNREGECQYAVIHMAVLSLIVG